MSFKEFMEKCEHLDKDYEACVRKEGVLRTCAPALCSLYSEGGIICDPVPTVGDNGTVESVIPLNGKHVFPVTKITSVTIGGYSPERIVEILKAAEKVVAENCYTCSCNKGAGKDCDIDECVSRKLKKLLGDK